MFAFVSVVGERRTAHHIYYLLIFPAHLCRPRNLDCVYFG